jgi:hypothetical protein
MIFLKMSIFAATTLFAMSNFAAAGTVVPTTGHGYGAVTSSTATPLADGSMLIKQTTHEVWIGEPNATNFPVHTIADCHGTLLLSEQGAPIAFRGVCSAADIDGDTFIATNGATTPDFSDCTWQMHGGTGKYAGVTGGGACIPGGPISKDGNNTKFSWTGEFVLP